MSSNNELNFARYISSLGLNLNGQLDKLIAPIPSKIVPLIFWDPIVQKLASIFKSANNPEMNRVIYVFVNFSLVLISAYNNVSNIV